MRARGAPLTVLAVRASVAAFAALAVGAVLARTAIATEPAHRTVRAPLAAKVALAGRAGHRGIPLRVQQGLERFEDFIERATHRGPDSHESP